ncbi:hypothetical protein [Hydrogenophaga sp. 5NK40-0174]|uniref:hypothetical protein n=1 Tax=Hydrogenophaga sp. 5NK40-0174 TaxID=3127649 RepID=UPI0031064BB3
MNWRSLHRSSAFVIGAFAVVHLLNHLAMIGGADAHIGFMNVARALYRQPVVEGLLLFCVAFQAGSGAWMLIRGWRARSGLIAWLQALSGAYLALFLVNHVVAVLSGRVSDGLDTNLHFAAAGFYVDPWPWFFAPYYFVAVLALLTHIGCAIYWNLPEATPEASRKRWVFGSMAAGTLMGAIFVAGMNGAFGALDVPGEYTAPYRR